MSILINSLLIFSVIFLTACGSPQTVRKDPEKEIPTQPPGTPIESRTSGNNATPTAGVSVLKLLEVARSQAESGQGDLAAATLERAIKIEPDNPWLWHRLAVLRMQQKNWSQSIELANRSIALAKGNHRLIGGNWLVISLALEGAENYEASAKAKMNSDVYLGKE